MPHQLVIPVVRQPEYEISIEQFDELSFLHCRVVQWTPSVCRALRRDFDTFSNLHGGPFFVVGTDDPKLPKFLRLFGFRPDGTCHDIDGTERPLFRRD